MGQSQSLATEIEIQASPEKVRSVFLDFPRYKEWASNWTIEPVGDGAVKAKEGETLKVTMKGMTFRPVVLESSNESFKWEGSIPLLFTGQHHFYWYPSEKTPGGTRVVQSENFSGLMAFMMGPGWSMRQSTLDGWNGFFADLKKEVEKSSS